MATKTSAASSLQVTFETPPNCHLLLPLFSGRSGTPFEQEEIVGALATKAACRVNLCFVATHGFIWRRSTGGHTQFPGNEQQAKGMPWLP